MVLNRILKYINLVIAAALAAMLLVVYWFAWRPLPKTSGSLQAPVAAQATITRDGRGVPHISAGDAEDAIFLQGFATAQDRLWQMDLLRRHAGGELAEVFGRSAVESDGEARRLRMRRAAEGHVRSLPAADRAVLAAYARGVNFFLETHQDKLPLEFTLLGYDPRPWTLADSVLVGLQMFRTLTGTWRDELQKQKLLDGGDPPKVNLLFPPRSGHEVQIGSNAWAIAGSRTRSGRPLLANDPHLEFSWPSTWHQVHLRAEGLDVAGAALPGVPGVIIGHNRRIAWGVTNLHFDVQDLFRVTFDPGTGRYLFQGKAEQARLERSVIAVKGGKTVETALWVTRHGPIHHVENNRFFSLRWTATEDGGFQFPFLDLNRASNWAEFRKALSRFPGPGQNFLYADVDGNIGYQAAGHFPVRRSYTGDLPVDGSSGEFRWEGFIPFEELPFVFNPPSGLIVSANQNPFPPNFSHKVNGNFSSPYRSRQIQALLSGRKDWRAEDMLSIQKDIYSPFLHFLAGQAVAAWEKRESRQAALSEAAGILKRWDGQMEIGRPAPLVATLLYQHLRRAAAENASPGNGGAYEYQMAPAVLEFLLRNRPTEWFSDYELLLLRSLADAVEEGQRMQGRDVAKWDYGRYNQLTIRHPILSRIAWVGRYFQIGPVPMSGSSTTVKQVSGRLGPSMRMVADLSDWDRSLLNTTLGESGHVLSSHSRDQWKAYYAGESFPMPFTKVEGDTLMVESSTATAATARRPDP